MISFFFFFLTFSCDISMGANLASDDRGSVVRHSVTRNNTGESLVRLDAGFVLYDANLRGLSSQWGWY